jgi:hypothetical protein
MSEVGRTEGRNIPIVPTIGDIMKRAGFVDVEKKTFRVPYGTWPTDATERRRGACLSVNAELLLPTSSRLLGTIGMTAAQAESLYADISNMFHDDAVHCFATYFVWYGRKPELEDDSFGGEGR